MIVHNFHRKILGTYNRRTKGCAASPASYKAPTAGTTKSEESSICGLLPTERTYKSSNKYLYEIQ